MPNLKQTIIAVHQGYPRSKSRTQDAPPPVPTSASQVVERIRE